MDSPNIPPPPAPPAYTEDAPSAGGERAGFWPRLAQYVIDLILIGVVTGIIAAVVGASPNARIGFGQLVAIVYFTALEGSSSQTIGMRALSLKVVDARTGGATDYSRAFIRSLARIVAGLVCALGYFWVIWDKEKQGWHDKIATTYVVPHVGGGAARLLRRPRPLRRPVQRAELAAAGELLERAALDLTDALARDPEPAADLLERERLGPRRRARSGATAPAARARGAARAHGAAPRCAG